MTILNNPKSKATTDESDKTYHVHRNILAIGERRSGYFANLLHYGIDDGNKCSSLELSSRAVAFFPDLLDYMYSSKAFAISTTNAIPLLFLSQVFQVVSLEASVKTFIDTDIKLYNFGYYMSDALYFSDETIALKVIDTCEKEAMMLFNNGNQNADLALSKILKAPLLSSVTKADKLCQGVWSFLTNKQPNFTPKSFSSKSFFGKNQIE